MIDLTVDKKARENNIKLARRRGVVLPTLAQMRRPATLPDGLQRRLEGVGLWDIDPLNLLRITWRNQPLERGGRFGGPNYIVLPKSLTGVDAPILCMVGKWFPTGCHKVGASYGCLVPRLVTGQFDTARHKAAWPSTGNYCRGGAFNSALLGVHSIAILPQGMSRERFDWLKTVASEIIATPGSESNVKEIFDETARLKQRDDVMVFNQFEEMGNHLWHYAVTGPAIAEAFEAAGGAKGRLAALCLTSGSAGTLAAGDYLKEHHPAMKLAVGEALQCPTLLENGFGEHRIEGIGDKHVPWIHNVRNTDLVIAIDDEDSQHLLRLFNDAAGRGYLAKEAGVPPETVAQLGLLGISGIANLLCAIKTAKYYGLGPGDVVATVLTDSAAMYGSRVEELAAAEGGYTPLRAAADFGRRLLGQRTDNMLELDQRSRKRIHNLKYYTWVEQQGRTAGELDALWDDPEGTWGAVHRQAEDIDRLIEAFNAEVGL